MLADAGYDVVGITLQLYDHGAATHRKGACCAGRDIHDARAVAERIGIPHYVLDYEDRFKEAVIDRFAESYVAGETPVPCVECNQSIKFRDLLAHRARTRRRGAGDRPLRRLARAAGRRPRRSIARAKPSATRAISCSPPRARSSICCAFRSATAPRRKRANWRAASGCPSPTSRTARTSASCRPGIMPTSSSGCGRAPPGRAKSSISTAACSAIMTASSISPSASAAGSASPPARRFMWCGSTPPSRRVVVGPREALRTSRIRLRDINWLGDGTIEAGAGAPSRSVSSKSARRGRRSRLAARRRDGGIEVELIAGEDGVSPGQACVFYDAAEGQARVLGGGVIAGTVAATRAVKDALARRRSRAPRIDRAADREHGTTTMAAELDNAGIAKAYARWAPIYDLVFGAVFDRGRKASIAAAERIGGRILEVGVGTGLSLPDYAWSNRLIGVDLSAPMLRKAKARVVEHRLTNVDGLAVMDAQHLGFQDAAFDVVVAQYVITAVPDPEATLDEFARVVRPGGEIVLVNHLGAESGLRAPFRAMVRAAGAPARLAAGIPLGAARAMGGAPWRRARRSSAGRCRRSGIFR